MQNGQLDFDTEDTECPLCLEEMDISDLNFKPCSCGYRICRFCWHHIKENLNGRCPACRKEYSDEAVEFTPLRPEDIKKLQNTKKQKEREKKDTEVNSRKHLANVRIKQRTQAHIQGMTHRVANEDSIQFLKSPEQFGQYGKILKLFLAKRTNMPESLQNATNADPKSQPVNVYINYSSAREASACILATDGSTFEGLRLRAGWGTTKYCPQYLKGAKCNQDNCMMAHEPGEEVDPVGGAPGPVTREEMSTLKHAMKEQETRDRPSAHSRSSGSNVGLPASASWAKGMSLPSASAMSASPSTSSLPPAPIPKPPSHLTKLPRATNHPLPARPPSREAVVAAATAARTRQGSVQSMVGSATRRSSQSSNADERPLGPMRRTSLIDLAAAESSSPSSHSQSNSISHESNIPPFHLGPPPGLSKPSPPPVSTSEQPVASTSSLSTAVQAPEKSSTATLLNGYDSAMSDSPQLHDYLQGSEEDFEATLNTFSEGGFSFSLNIDVPVDKNGKGKERSDLPSLDKINVTDSNRAVDGLFNTDHFSPVSANILASGSVASLMDRTNSQDGKYSGAFDPFAESPMDDETSRPRSSRFDFAKKGLFGSSDSLSNLAYLPSDPITSRAMSAVTNGPNGRASPLSILTAGTALRANSPKRNLTSPPPGLKSASPANDASWMKNLGLNGSPRRSNSPGPGAASAMDASNFLAARSAMLPLSSAATSPLPHPSTSSSFASHIPPSLGDFARQPLPTLSSAAGHSLPPPKATTPASASLPPGLNLSGARGPSMALPIPMNDDAYSHMIPGAALNLPSRSSDHTPFDPAIVSMSQAASRFPSLASPSLANLNSAAFRPLIDQNYHPQHQSMGIFAGQQQQVSPQFNYR